MKNKNKANKYVNLKKESISQSYADNETFVLEETVLTPQRSRKLGIKLDRVLEKGKK